MRAIPNSISYYSADAPDVPINRCAFEPHKQRDHDGLSFFRFDFITPKQLALSNKNVNGVFITKILVDDLYKLGLTVLPKPTPDFSPGHVIIPELNYGTFCQNKPASKRIQLELAKLASKRIVYGPTSPK